MSPPSLYTGTEKLVLSIDVGTTTSSIALAHLAPGNIPKVQPVTTALSVPSEVFYDASGQAVACGHDCHLPSTLASASTSGWQLARFFKLALHPPSLHYTSPGTSYPIQLPLGVPIGNIYASFIHYLCDLAAKWFADAELHGADAWAKCFWACEVVLATPDGWDERQQKILWKALALAGIVPEGATTGGEDRVHFVREAEASVNFAMKDATVREWMKPGATFTVVDAGGSTVDTCMYLCEAVTPKLLLSEVKPSDCIQAGGIFVDRAASNFLETKLAGSKFADSKYLCLMVAHFETKTKRKFSGDGLVPSVGVGVVQGRISLTSDEVANIFHFCVNEIVASVQPQIVHGRVQSSHIILTGGFGDSPYLQSCLRTAFPNLALVIPADEGKKVVADGGLLSYISESVAARAVRATFGVVGTHPYIAARREHQMRRPQMDRDGRYFLDGCWSQMVEKGEIMKANEPYERCCYELVAQGEIDRLRNYSVDLWVTMNDGPQADWAFDAASRTLPGFQRRCTVTADLSSLKNALVLDKTHEEPYYVVDFRICLYLAQNTLRARIKWMENRTEREGPAMVTFDEMPRAVVGGSEGRAPAANVLG